MMWEEIALVNRTGHKLKVTAIVESEHPLGEIYPSDSRTYECFEEPKKVRYKIILEEDED